MEELTIDSFIVLPELIENDITIEASKVEVSSGVKMFHKKAYEPCDQCLASPEKDSDFVIMLRNSDFWVISGLYIILASCLSFLVMLGFYKYYKKQSIKNPWKCTIKRSWPWWTIIFLVPIIIFFLCYFFIFKYASFSLSFFG